MPYTWDSKLETGNTLIDQQHKQLFEAINALMEACSKGQGRAKIEETLIFLQDYIAKHFGDEEVLQQKYQYPDIVNHKGYHREYIKMVDDIMQEFKSSGATIALLAKTNTTIAGWLINHIKTQDVKEAQHIKSKTN